jgi:hypothetical protein
MNTGKTRNAFFNPRLSALIGGIFSPNRRQENARRHEIAAPVLFMC